MDIQNKIKENAEDLQLFLKDLDTWEKDMKKKEKELTLIQTSEDKAIPPVRNSIYKSKKKNKRKTQTDGVPSTKTRISAFDYESWDKFDVNSELKKLDDEKDKASSSDDSQEEEKFAIQQKKQLAIIKKDKGNEFFKKCNYDSAINCYTEGIELDPTNALLPANRAMAFLKKEQYQAAENDCTLCISLDNTYVKAFLRRGSARKALDKLVLAKNDFLKALELEPENKQAQVELEQINKVFQEKADKMDSEVLLKRSEDSRLAYREEMKCLPESETVTENIVKRKEISCAFPDSKRVEFKLCEKPHPEESMVSVPCTSVSKEKFATDIHQETATGAIDELIESMKRNLPPPPASSYRFMADWSSLSRDPELKYRYLKQIPPEHLPAIFRFSMEPVTFTDIITVLGTSFVSNGDDVFEYLKFLSLVGKFKLMPDFLVQKEKDELDNLFRYSANFNHSSEEISHLRSLYKI